MQDRLYIEALLSHNQEVLNKLYLDFTPRIKSYIKQRGGTTEDAKDVFQDALMIIYHKAKSDDFELTSKFSTYLLSICFFIWSRKKKKKANNTVTIPEVNGYTIDENIETDILRRERERIFKEKFLELGKICQSILTMFFNKKNMAEITEALDLKNEHTTRNRKYRCQKQLEEQIKQDIRYKELID